MASRPVDLRIHLTFRGAVQALAAVAAEIAGVVTARDLTAQHHWPREVRWVEAVAVVAWGVVAVRWGAVALGRMETRRSNIGAGAVVRLVSNGVGALAVIFGVLSVLGVSLTRLLIGAGVASIVIGVAAQQSLANIIAALVLLIARPFVVGDEIIIRSGALGALEGHVVGIGLTYVTLRTEESVIRIPNSVMLASGIARSLPTAP
ncbi:MAG: mechanosensitive ion channel [Acidimicrobiaceae bacterium]|nr:mechanosensitive ion channel [Acidimicrobiaceae bacterium]